MAKEDSFPHVLKSFIVITLFMFLVLGFIIGLAGNYGTDTTEVSDRIGLDKINDSLSVAQSTAVTWQSTFEDIGEGNIFQDLLDVLGLLSVGMFNLVKGMITSILAPFSILGNILSNVLGVPIIVVAIINVILILTIIFGIWSLIKRGV